MLKPVMQLAHYWPWFVECKPFHTWWQDSKIGYAARSLLQLSSTCVLTHEVFAFLEDPSYRNVGKNPSESMEQKTAVLTKKSSLSEDAASQLLPHGLKSCRWYRFPKILEEGTPWGASTVWLGLLHVNWKNIQQSFGITFLLLLTPYEKFWGFLPGNAHPMCQAKGHTHQL